MNPRTLEAMRSQESFTSQKATPGKKRKSSLGTRRFQRAGLVISYIDRRSEIMNPRTLEAMRTQGFSEEPSCRVATP